MIYIFLMAFALTGILPVSSTSPSKSLKASSRRYSPRKLKRSIVTYPPNSVIQMTLGVTIEGDIERNVAGFAVALQYNANLPNDSKFLFSNQIISLRSFSLYDYLTDTFLRFGYNGIECLKKMICQISRTPLEGDILEDLVNYFLTPSKYQKANSKNWKGYTKNKEVNFEELLESEAHGKKGRNCTSIYSLCANSPLDLITDLEYGKI